MITEFCNQVIDGTYTPVDWNSTFVWDCGAYRGVELLERGMKLLLRRLRVVFDSDEMLCCFMLVKGMMDGCNVHGENVAEEYERKKRKLFECFYRFGDGIYSSTTDIGH